MPAGELAVVRDARNDDLESALACYARNGYQGGIKPHDRVVLAERAGSVVGVGRIVEEHDHVILRGMFVDEAERGQGTGSIMLARLVAHIGDRPAWLITSPKRFRFYAQAGFAPTDQAAAPPHLWARAMGYRAEHGEQAVLHRAAPAPQAGGA